MTYKAKAAVCSQIRTKHPTQSEHHVELLNIKPGNKGIFVYYTNSLTQIYYLFY